MKLTIYHTNDIHSHFEEFSRIAACLRRQRKPQDLLLDAGDLHDFLRPEMSGTNGRIGKYLLEYLEYDAVAAGNNEGFTEPDALAGIAKTGKVPVLSANITQLDGSPVPMLKKSILLSRGPERILIIGMSPGGDSYNDFYHLSGLEAEEAGTALRRELESRAGQYDVCVLLSHLGIEEDRRLARLFPQLQVIIGGHSHTVMETPERVGGAVIHQAGGYGTYLGKLTLEIEDHKVTDFSGELIESAGFEPDPGFLQLYQEQKAEAEKNLRRPLFTLAETLWFDPVMENPLTNFIADQLYRTYSCDFACINSGIVSFGLTGTISKMKLLQASPSHLNPTHGVIRGQQLYEAVCQTLMPEHCLAPGRGPGFRGMLVGRLHVSENVKIVVRDGQPEIFVDGQPLVMERDYRVVMTDYLQRGSGYPSLATEREVVFEAGFIRDLLLRTLPGLSVDSPCFRKRYEEGNRSAS